MKKYENEFLKFTNLNSCTDYEFKLAKKYFEHATDLEKTKFYNVIFAIVQKAFKEMIKKQTANYKILRNIYSNYGITDDDFEMYFNLFMEHYASEEIIKTYAKLQVRDDEVLAKDIFEKAKKLNWNNLSQIAKEYKITCDQVKDYIDYYAFKFLKLDKNKFTKYKKAFKAFQAFINFQNHNLKKALEFYNTYASNQEKNDFLEIVNFIIKQVKSYKDNKNGFAEYIKSIGLDMLDIITLIQKFASQDKHLIILISNFFKDYYEFCESVNWNKAKITEMAESQNMNYKDYVYLARFYAIKVLNIDDVATRSFTANYAYIHVANFSNVLFQILDENDETLIYRLFEDNGITKDHIMRFCYSMVRNFTNEERVKNEKLLLEKFSLYLKYKKEKNSKKRLIPEKTFLSFLDSQLQVRDFCENNGILLQHFNDSLKRLDNQELAKKCLDKIVAEQEEEILLTKNEQEINNLYRQSRVKLFVSYIKSGININGVVKKFDLLDFFMLFKDINPYSYCYPFLDLEERKILKGFLSPFMPFRYEANYVNPESLLNSHIEFNCLKDEFGNPIKNSGRVISRIEIAYVISFLKENDIPMYDVIFNIALKRYLNNTLDIYKTTEPTLK